MPGAGVARRVCAPTPGSMRREHASTATEQRPRARGRGAGADRRRRVRAHPAARAAAPARAARAARPRVRDRARVRHACACAARSTSCSRASRRARSTRSIPTCAPRCASARSSSSPACRRTPRSARRSASCRSGPAGSPTACCARSPGPARRGRCPPGDDVGVDRDPHVASRLDRAAVHRRARPRRRARDARARQRAARGHAAREPDAHDAPTRSPPSCARSGSRSSPATLVPDALLVRHTGDLGALDALRDGRVTPQDQASQAVVAALDPQPGERVLDVASAPGGKATAAAERMRDDGLVVAADVHPARVRTVMRAARALRARRRSCRSWPTAAASRSPTASFDRVLLDAPCTGLGVLRRRPDARWRVQPRDATDLADLQRALLDGRGARGAPGRAARLLGVHAHAGSRRSRSTRSRRRSSPTSSRSTRRARRGAGTGGARCSCRRPRAPTACSSWCWNAPGRVGAMVERAARA